jgi:outer membrane protein
MQVATRAARVLAAAILVGQVTAPAFGQGTPGSEPQVPQPATPPAGQPAVSRPLRPALPPPTGPVRRVTIDEAVALGLDQNLSLRVERINPEIQDENVRLARTAWTPVLSGSMGYNNASNPPDSFLSGASETLRSDLFNGGARVQQVLPWGATYEAAWDNSRYTSNSIFSTFNPRLRSSFNLTFSQPILRNFAIDSQRQQLLVSRKNREMSETDLRAAVVNTIRNVKNAYVDLSFARASLAVQQQSLELAEHTLRDNRTRVEIGTMAPIDIVEAEAEVARNEETVIVAEAAIRQAEDRLRSLVFDPATPDLWNLTIEPAEETPPLQPITIDPDQAVREALSRRTDLQQARKNLEISDVNLRYYRNQTLPQLNLQVDYGAVGLGGTNFERAPGFPPGDVVREVERSYRNALGDVFSAAYPTWQVGFVASYPIGRNAAHTNFTRSQLQLRQLQLQVQNLEQQITTQVREVIRQQQTAQKRVDATRAALQLAERRLEAEQKKFAVGMSTNFLVFQAQRDLAQARSNELRAWFDLYKAQSDYEAVLETSIGGSTGISIAGSGSATVPGGGNLTGFSNTGTGASRQVR